MEWTIRIAALVCAAWLVGCGADDSPDYDPDGIGADATDAADLVDTAGDPPVDPPVDTGPDDGSTPADCPEKSYIWIANSAEGTLSKLCTITGDEMGRYVTSSQGASGDPSRTSVNLHGDMVVTNRDPSPGPSSVTKFAAEPADCIDRNGDTVIQTSTGPDDVLPWGEDECMIWNTPLPREGAAPQGCRATAWQGDEDPDTGLGGHVWIGCMLNRTVYKIDGDTGTVLDQVVVTGIGHYGGAMDGNGSFWTVDMFCTVSLCRIAQINLETLAFESFRVPCGYGISVDHLGRIWTAGMGCVNRHDPITHENTTLATAAMQFNRGIAVDNEGSVWAAVTTGDVLRVDEDTVTEIHQFPAGPAEIVGVAIDFHGYVWAVSQGGNKALKIDPDTYAVEDFDIGNGPYTYSDMTGYQLSIVEIPF